jgi:hypothetical protein
LFDAYYPTDWNGREGRSLKTLSQDPDFMLKFRILQLAKFHNQYGEVDQLMRQFAKACTQLPDHATHIA